MFLCCVNPESRNDYDENVLCGTVGGEIVFRHCQLEQ